MRLNEHFKNLGESYLFVTIAKKVRPTSRSTQRQKSSGWALGDVTRPLAPAVIDALHKAVEDQARQETFHATPRTATATPFSGRPSPGTTKTSGWSWTPRRSLWGTGPKATWGTC